MPFSPPLEEVDALENAFRVSCDRCEKTLPLPLGVEDTSSLASSHGLIASAVLRNIRLVPPDIRCHIDGFVARACVVDVRGHNRGIFQPLPESVTRALVGGLVLRANGFGIFQPSSAETDCEPRLTHNIPARTKAAQNFMALTPEKHDFCRQISPGNGRDMSQISRHPSRPFSVGAGSLNGR